MKLLINRGALKFKTTPSDQGLLPIELISETSLDDVTILLIITVEEAAPMKMKDSGDKKHWVLEFMPIGTVTKDYLRVYLAVSYKASLYFAEFSIIY